MTGDVTSEEELLLIYLTGWTNGKTSRHYGSKLSLQLFFLFDSCWWSRTIIFLRMEHFKNNSCGNCHPYAVPLWGPLRGFLCWTLKFQSDEMAQGSQIPIVLACGFFIWKMSFSLFVQSISFINKVFFN